MDSKAGAIAVSGDLKRALSSLVLPALLMQIVQTAGWLGEAYFVGKLGKVETAAIGLVGEISWLLSTLTTLVTVSATTLVAQRWGAGDKSGAKAVMLAAAQQSVFFGIFALTVWFLRDLVWGAMGADVEVRKAAQIYLLASLLSFPLMNLAASFGAVLRGIGDMKTPLLVSSIATGVHFSLNATLTPVWGISGAAAALSMSRIVAVALFALCLRRSPFNSVSSPVVGWSSDYHRELLSLGIPAGAQTLFWSLASVVFFSMLNRLPNGTAAVAAFTIGIRIESAAFMVAIAFAMATQTIVGQNVGANQWKRAWVGTWHSTLWCIAVIMPICVVLFFGADWLAAKFSTDPLTRSYAAQYLRVAAIAEPFWALSMTTGAALQGAGDTRTPALIAILTQWLFALPLTYAFCVLGGHSPKVAWWIVGASGFLTGIITAAAFTIFWRKQKTA
ncbi:MAG: MATE family efflux transporter [Armatimonadetes bacterium]|nr:MATE family efflux transporter [Armatimonadota bacterium]